MVVDYRTEIARIRTERDRELDRLWNEHYARTRRIKREAGAAIGILRDERDARIRELEAAGVTHRAIAAVLGVDRGTIYELLHPDRRAAYNERRRLHMAAMTADDRAAYNARRREQSRRRIDERRLELIQGGRAA